MKKSRWYDLIAVNLFWLGLNFRNNAVGAIFMPYLVDIFVNSEIKNTALGGMRTAGLVIAMLVQPAAGLLSDRSTSRWGRRRPFIFIGVLLDLVLLAAIGFAWDYASLLVVIMLLQISSNLSHGPLQALIPDMVPEEQRGFASGFKAIFELVPLVLIGFTIAALVGRGELGWGIFATGAVLLATMLITVVWVKEQPIRAKPDVPFWPPMMRVLGMLAGIGIGAVAGLAGGGLLGGLSGLVVTLLSGDQIGRIAAVGVGGLTAMTLAVVVGVWAGASATLGRQTARRHSSFTWWVVNRLLFLAAVTSIQSFAPYFLMYAFAISRETAVELTGRLMTLVGLFTLLTALPGGWLSDRFGHKRIIALSGWMGATAAFLLLGTIWMPNLALIYLVGAILGLATGLFVTANWALGTALVPGRQAGHFLGISNLAGAGAGMIGAGIGGPIADYLNSLQPGLGYFTVFACYAVLFVFSAASLWWVRIPEPAEGDKATELAATS